MKLKKIFFDGIFSNNPVLVQLVGMCSVLAVTTSVVNAIGMGSSVIFVVTCSNIVISSLRKFIPDKVRIPAYVVIIATFVTLVQMFLSAYIPALYDSLGLFIPLIVVNCLILARAESFASKNTVFSSMIDGIGQGIGFTCALIVLASVREILGNGTWLGFSILGKNYVSIGVITQAPGAFIILGLLVAGFNMLSRKVNAKKEGGN
ncbi:electron transport complex subunit RsxE [Parvimonas micra]|uniref:electron transport complex subunit RsxE n=1 Tax=Parvimonas micra TaxID=33033 RepID=UPI0022B5E9A2|nr:electron transport complex subunit E [Parvimonas micra]WBB29671.1 electron transport complex subunit E [Parvimonas micra]